MTTTTEHAHTFKVTRQWVLAGKAIFTVKNNSGEHYTFKVSRVHKENDARPPVWFMSMLTGPDNEADSSYAYIGIVLNVTNEAVPLDVKLTAKSRFVPATTAYRVARWALARICLGGLPEGYSIDGNGRCGRCGRMLTHPDGIADDGYRLGFGPVCWEQMGGGL
jgi:hypothetical protein